MKINTNDTPAIIAAKWLNGALAGVSVRDAMLEIRKRAAAIENQFDETREELAQRKRLRAVK